MISILSVLGFVIFPLSAVTVWKNPPRPDYRISFLAADPQPRRYSRAFSYPGVFYGSQNSKR